MSAEYTMNELEEYFENNVQDKISDEITSELIKQVISQNGENIVKFTIIEVDKLAGLGNKKANEILEDLLKKYEIGIDYDELGEKCADAVSLVTDIVSLGEKIYHLSGYIDNYLDNRDSQPYLASDCMGLIFNVLSDLSDMTGGPLGSIISEQLSLGSFLLEKGTDLIKEYNKRFDDLEEIWEEIEQSDSVDNTLQDKINQAVQNSASDLQTYNYMKVYDAIMQEYGWLFDIIDNKDTKKIKEQYETIKTKLEAGQEFYDMYNNVYQYMTTTEYLTGSGTTSQKIFTQKENDSVTNAKQKTDPPKDPIVLDLNQDGIYSTDLEHGTHFDYDGDGFAEKTAWVTAEDGLLVRDINGNGIIDNGSELFGDRTILSDGSVAADGFQALQDLDDNGDGSINHLDKAFLELKVWTDKNGDGITQADELHTLTELDITGILLNKTGNRTDQNGNTITGTAEILREEKSRLNLAELNFRIDYSDTTYTQKIEIPQEIAAMPQLIAAGTVLSLQEAMTLDKELQTLVSEFLNADESVRRENLLQALVLKWTGCENIEEGSRGTNMEASKLAVIEKLCGQAYTGVDGANPNVTAAEILNGVYNDIMDNIRCKLLVQAGMRELIGHTVIITRPATGEKQIDYSEIMQIFDTKIQENTIETMMMFECYITYISKMSSVSDLYNREKLNEAIDKSPYKTYYKDILNHSIKLYGTSGNDTISDNSNSSMILAGEGNDTIYGGNGDDYIIGGAGNDSLIGGDGADTYFFNLGDGQDVIDNYDYYGWRNDRIVFGEGINPEDIKAVREGNDLLLTNEKSGDSVRLLQAYTGYNCAYWLGKIEFADGTVWTPDTLWELTRHREGTAGDDIMTGISGGYYYNVNEIFRAGAGNDTIYGGNGDDYIIGGAGNDSLIGGDGADTYFFNLGDGQDVIDNYDYYGWRNDRIVFGEGINPEDIKAVRDGNDLLLTNEKSGDSVRLLQAYTGYNCAYWLGKIEFADGTVWTPDTLWELTRHREGTAGDDIMTGISGGYYYNVNEIFRAGAGNDTIYGGNGDDTLIGGAGNDSLIGGDGADTYFFNLGDGQDVIDNYDYYGWRNDRIAFGEGINPEDIKAVRDGNDLLLTNEKSGDSVRLLQAYTGYNCAYWLGKIEFADGTVWTPDTLWELTRHREGTAGDDIMTGISGGYYYNVNEIFHAGAGNDTIYGGNGDDTLIGGEGNDSLIGGDGADTYFFNLGDGQDVIDNYDYYGWRNDRIAFGEGINPEDIKAVRDGNDLLLTNEKSGDSVRLLQAYTGYNCAYWLGKIEFADGTVWTPDTLWELTRHREGTAGDDIMTGISGGYYYNVNEIFNAGAGNDTIYGGNGDDTYIFDKNFGTDVVYDSCGANTIAFGEGIAIEELNVLRNGNNLELGIKGTEDKVILADYYYGAAYQNFTYTFQDGTTLSNSDITDIMNGTYVYASTLKQASLLVDELSAFGGETAISDTIRIEQDSTVSANTSQLWTES